MSEPNTKKIRVVVHKDYAMNVRDNIIQKNLERCQLRTRMLTTVEIKFVESVRLNRNLSQDNFNKLARIAEDGERRKFNIEVNLSESRVCPNCGKKIMWIDTHTGKKILIDAKTYNGEKVFNPQKNTCHWDECDYKHS